jgi:hypothetical protein
LKFGADISIDVYIPIDIDKAIAIDPAARYNEQFQE